VKRLFVILIAIALPLVLAPTAQAKGPVKSLEVCGGGGCATIPIAPGHGRQEGLGMLLASPAIKVPWPRPYVDLNVVLGLGEGTIKMFYVPGAQVVYNQGWSQVAPALGAKLDAAAARVSAREPRLTAVVVGERLSRDPGAYAALLSALEPARQPTSPEAPTVGIQFTTSRATPWTPRESGYATYVPSAHLIRIGLDWFRPSAALDAQIRRDAAMETAARAASGRGLSPWWLVLPAAGAGAALLVIVLRRRRAHPRTVPVA
jgi:hypothetical protein